MLLKPLAYLGDLVAGVSVVAGVKTPTLTQK
jgi:hypothetical protein